MKNFRCKFNSHILSLLLTFLIASCGGSGGNLAGGGIGGTGISFGTITGFGSVFVNGVEFDTSGSTFDVDDNPAAMESDLGVGMVVTVTGFVNNDGITGSASSIEYDEAIEGPISTNPVEDADMVTKTFDVLGITVAIDRNNTVFVNTDYGSLAQNDVVEVSGHVDANGDLQATRVEKTGVLVPTTEIETRGTVSGFDNIDTFMLGSLMVTFDGMTVFEDLPGTVSNGQYVEVKGRLTGPAAVLATRIELESEDFGDNVAEISIEGIVSDFNGIGDFKVAGQVVNALTASFEPISLGSSIADGDKVEVEGEIVGRVLIADEVEQRDGSIEISATVLSTGVGTVNMLIASGQLTVQTDTQTQFEDERDGVEPFGITNILPTDFLEIEGYQDSNGDVIATQIDRKLPNDIKLQGPADVPGTTGNSSSGMVSILGITIVTGIMTDFEDANDMPITGDTFFMTVSDGDLVKFKDRLVPDGIADEVEFEDL
jgi:hypothetical protein